MSAAEKLDKAINTYLAQLNTAQKKAVLTVVKTFATENETATDKWDDPAFIATIERRTRELETGAVKGISWETAKARTLQSLKARKK